MVLLRLVYAAELLPPGELLKATSQTDSSHTAPRSSPPPSGGGAQMRVVSGGQAQSFAPAPQIAAVPLPKTFADAVALFEEHKEAILHSQLYGQVHIVNYAPPRMDVRLAAGLPRDFTGKIAQKLQQWTGTAWLIGIANEGGEITLAEQETARADARLQAAAANPMVRAVMAHFPGARILKITEPDMNNETGDME